MTFSENLAALRKARGLLQKEVAEAANLAVRAYQRYEYGQREPTLSTLVALADFYAISVDELICHQPKDKKQ